MEPLRSCVIFGVIIFAINADETTYTFPPELLSAEAKVAVRSTGCSVSCGLGVKEQEFCLVKPDGSESECEKRRDECMISWDCGLQTFTIPTGTPFQINCFSSNTVGIGLQSFLYTWRYAYGLITTLDALFKVYRVPGFIIRFNATKEENAGTYRCDVLQLQTSKFVKRIYFGLKIISESMVQLNFDKYHTTKEELKELEVAPDNFILGFIHKHLDVDWTYEHRMIFIGVVGIGSGLVASAIIWVTLRSFYNLLKKRKIRGDGG
ncbi:hypothetical protein NDU88_004513 [Pleurodeles waltl]|uniref:Transmembrane protein 81 n=2 Tax=Pleurodeles waltl TaxID=8319 RepID=A0AAV7QFP5_PLEWA|nr:hypothetical protein NDU88_004513 [Pleurodeles waltl]